MAEQICTFLINGIYFGINVQHVQEVIRPQPITRVPLQSEDICGLINLRGQIITVIDLQRRLEMDKHTQSPTKLVDPQFNIVVCSDSEVVSLVVDDVGDVLEFKENTFQPPPATLKGKMRQMLAGAYLFEDKFLLVLDTAKIINANSMNN